MAAVPNNVILWPYRRIPYYFQEKFPFKSEVRSAMRKWEKAVGVDFIEFERNLMREPNFLFIKCDDNGSRSEVTGMKKSGGEQSVYINGHDKALHELGHVIGLIHEQKRSDRDNHIKLLRNNIDPRSMSQFSLMNDSLNLTSYDKKSIMHYPAPAIGWGGTPPDKKVYTMQDKEDPNKHLGPDGWTGLSDLDKSPDGLFSRYSKMPLPMKPEVDRGSWDYAYEVQFSFSHADRKFIYGQRELNSYWFIQEIFTNGKMGDETDKGTWKRFYGAQFPFSIGGRVFFFGQSISNKNWFIQELLANGKMGKETDKGNWPQSFGVQFSYSIGDRVFFYGQNLKNKDWFIRELLPGGKLGTQTHYGTSGLAYKVQFPFKIGDRVFIYKQSTDSNQWFTTELLSGGKMGRLDLAFGIWDNFYDTQFAYEIDGNHYFFAQSKKSKVWFIRRLNADGTVGNEIERGRWNNFYAVQLPFKIGRSQYFYGQRMGNYNNPLLSRDYNWFMATLQDVK